MEMSQQRREEKRNYGQEKIGPNRSYNWMYLLLQALNLYVGISARQSATIYSESRGLQCSFFSSVISSMTCCPPVLASCQSFYNPDGTGCMSPEKENGMDIQKVPFLL